MQSPPPLQVISAVQVRSVEQIDGGDTIVVRFQIADGGETAMLVPVGQAVDLAKRILDEAGKPSARGMQRSLDLSAE